MDSTVTPLAFVVIKFKYKDKDCLLLRRDNKWHDINFVGGHAEKSDQGDAFKTALRELIEEIPVFQDCTHFHLELLNQNFEYGPVYSESSKVTKKYIVSFYLLKFTKPPTKLFQSMFKDENILLVNVEDFAKNCELKSSAFVEMFSKNKLGINDSRIYSWEEDLSHLVLDYL